MALTMLVSASAAYPSDLQADLRQADSFYSRYRLDSALTYYRRVSDAYSPDMNRKEMETCLLGVFGCFDANFYQGNYLAAFNDLLLAEQITQRDGFSSARLDMSYGSLYIALAAQMRKFSLFSQAIEHDRNAFYQALRDGDDAIIFRSFCDMFKASVIVSDPDSLDAEFKAMSSYQTRSASWRAAYALQIAQALKDFHKTRFRSAVSHYRRALSLLPPDAENPRLRAALFKDLSLALNEAREFPQAIAFSDTALRLSYRFNIRDLRLAALATQKRLFATIGDSVRKHLADAHYMALNDSLRSYLISDDLAQLEYVRERQQLQQRVARAELRQTALSWGCLVLFVIIAGSLIFFFVVRRKNRKLHERDRFLYENMKANYAPPKAVDEPADESLEGSPAETSRYEGSSLTEDDKDKIAADIRAIMTGDKIYEPGLTINRFADLVGRHPRAVSQVVHERFGCNFSTLVNRARIVEACRLMELPDYANYSVEGIAEKVGFKSRTAFSTNFAKFSGLSIREYRKAKQS